MSAHSNQRKCVAVDKTGWVHPFVNCICTCIFICICVFLYVCICTNAAAVVDRTRLVVALVCKIVNTQLKVSLSSAYHRTRDDLYRMVRGCWCQQLLSDDIFIILHITFVWLFVPIAISVASTFWKRIGTYLLDTSTRPVISSGSTLLDCPTAPHCWSRSDILKSWDYYVSNCLMLLIVGWCLSGCVSCHIIRCCCLCCCCCCCCPWLSSAAAAIVGSTYSRP